MGNREYILTETKQDLAVLFNLLPETSYLIQNNGDYIVRLGDFDDAASATERAAFVF